MTGEISEATRQECRMFLQSTPASEIMDMENGTSLQRQAIATIKEAAGVE